MKLQPPIPVAKQTPEEKIIEERCVEIASREYIAIGNIGNYVLPDWSIRAMVQAWNEAFEQGQRQGEATAEAEYRLLSEAMGQSFTEREDSLIKSAIMAMLEAFKTGMVFEKDKVATAVIDIEAMRAIHDRFKLGYEMINDGKEVQITLVKL